MSKENHVKKKAEAEPILTCKRREPLEAQNQRKSEAKTRLLTMSIFG